MKRVLSPKVDDFGAGCFGLVVVGLFVLALLFATPSFAYRAVTSCPSVTPIWTQGMLTVDPVVDLAGNVCTAGAADASQYPLASTPLTASATGTTGATTATLPGAASVTTYICGFSIRANATAAATAQATVTGVIVATMSFLQWTAPLASGIGTVEQSFYPCIPASAVNTSIAVVSAAPGAGGNVSVSAWGYRK